MKKVVLIISLLISVNLFADLVSEQKAMHTEGMVALRGGDYKEAIKKFKELCEDGYGLGCLKLGSMYRDGKGFKKDTDKAIELYKKSCTSNENTSGCYTLTKMLSKKEFNTYVTKLCNKNIGVGCFYLAEAEKGEKMAELYMKACDNGYLNGCERIGRKYLKGSKKSSIKKDRDKGLKLLIKTCEKNCSRACKTLSEYYRKKKDYKEYIKYSLKRCELGSGLSCYAMARAYGLSEYGVDENLTISKKLCQRAELFGITNGCDSQLMKKYRRLIREK